MFQFNGEGIEKDTGSDDEGTTDEGHVSDEFAETNIKEFDSLQLLEQVVSSQEYLVLVQKAIGAISSVVYF